MSDNTSDDEQQQQMQEISICADVWLEVFAFVSPVELGHLMALISDRFDVLVDEHFKTRKWSLREMEIFRAFDGNGAQIVNFSRGLPDRQPIPQGPIPNKVIGFEGINIRYIDGSVIEFLQRIGRLFNSSETTVAICTSEDQSRSWDIIRQKIWPLINDNICSFLLDISSLDRLRQFSPTVPHSTKLRSMDFFGNFYDNVNASSAQAVANWLLTPREDGRPKICHVGGMEKQLKEAFVNASSEPANFIISIWDDRLVPFELTNNLTRERLTLRQMDDDYGWLLVRCPIVREEDKWTNWEKEAIKWEWRPQWNSIVITFQDSDIGDG